MSNSNWKTYKSSFDKVKETIAKESVKEPKENEVKESWKFNPVLKINDKKVAEQTTWKIRFLPLLDSPTGKHWFEVRIHMFNRAGDNRRIKCIDTTTFDKKANNPIAKLGWDLYKSENSLDKQQSATIRSKLRIFTLIYIKDAPEHQKDLIGKVIPFESGEQIKKIIEQAIATHNLDFTHPENGTDFILTANPKKDLQGKVQPDYSASNFDRRDSPIAKDEDELSRVWAEVEKYTYTTFKDYIIQKLGGIPTVEQLEEYLNGGMKDGSTGSDKEVHDLSNQPASKPTPVKTTPKPDFGEPKKSTPAPLATAHAETKVDPDSINFDDADFNIPEG
jgi:hypothetical protein